MSTTTTSPQTPLPEGKENDREKVREREREKEKKKDKKETITHHYISNLRSTLTALVILHHTATTYGGIGRSPYQSTQHPQASSPALIAFNACNQSFFMGTYFYLAGHFSRKALERKSSRGDFLRERVWRLGVPTAGYTLLAAPFCAGVVRVWKGERVDGEFLREFWGGLRGPRGPVWFTGTLLLFDFIFAGWNWLEGNPSNRLDKKATRKEPSQVDENAGNDTISSLKLFSFIGLTSTAEFLLRIIYPIDTIFPPLKLNLGYVGQYVAAYALGTTSQHPDSAIPSPKTTLALSFLSLLTTATLTHYLFQTFTPLEDLRGGMNPLAASYSLWGNLMGYFLGGSLLSLFRSHAKKSWGWVNRVAFEAFLVHMPVLTVLGTMTDSWEMESVGKTILVGVVSIVGSWVVGGIGKVWWEGLKGSGRWRY